MKPIVRDAYVVANEGPPPRFLCRGPKPTHWTVVMEPERAKTFESRETADDALAEHVQHTSGHVHSAPGAWKIYRAKTRTTFEAA